MPDLMLESSTPPVSTGNVTSPWDGRVLGQVALAGPAHVEDALVAAHALFRERSQWLPVSRRVEILEKASEIVESRLEQLTLLAASEGGKPYSDSRIEVIRAIDGLKLCAETLRGEAGSVIPIGTTPATAGRVAFTHKEPIGVVVAVSAFNHPLNLIVHQVGPAIASACPVIVKPAGDTPLSCLALVSIFHEAGLPKAWCQAIVTENNEVATRLVTDERVGFFSFIGSARVGWMLRSKLAPGTRCALEHGGAAPLILAEPYDFDAAVAAVSKGGFYHAGQVCVSVQRVFAVGSEAQRFAHALARNATALKVGPPEDPDTEVGPLIRPAEVERIAAWVDEAVAGGAQCLAGGKQLANNSYAPTVLLDPPADAKVSSLEIFGPVVCVYSVENLDDAVRQANALPLAFQAAVFSQDVDIAMSLSRRLDASAVMINDHTAFRDDVMPFAGLRQSGLGTGGIPYTMHDMQIDKMTVIKSAGFTS